MRERLQKILASAGAASRRKAEALILEGRVKVNGQVAGLGDRADPRRDEVTLDGQAVRPEAKRYLVLNKPAGYVTTASDPHGEPTVMELVDMDVRVFPVGRLDRDTTGLLLFTNDGDFAHRVLHPRFEVKKTYVARLRRELSEEARSALLGGVELDDGPARAESVIMLDDEGREVEIVIHEGRKRVVRRMFQAVGNHVEALHRSRVGGLTLDGLPEGKWRELTAAEIVGLLGGRSPAFL